MPEGSAAWLWVLHWAWEGVWEEGGEAWEGMEGDGGGYGVAEVRSAQEGRK